MSTEPITTVTEAVVAEGTVWQARLLEPMYPVDFFDALRVKSREEAGVRDRAIYLDLGARWPLSQLPGDALHVRRSS